MQLDDTKRRKGVLLDALAAGSTLREACRIADVPTGNHYFWLKNDEAYIEGYKMAQAMRTDLLEEEAERRALNGYEEVITFVEKSDTGEMVETGKKIIRRYSDALLVLLLKAGNREKFGDQKRLEINKDDSVISALLAARKRIAEAEDAKT